MIAQFIDTATDEELVSIIFDDLSQRLTQDHTKEYKTVMSWNKSQQAIYMIWWLEAEVNNGGFNQFYYNPSGQFYKYLPDALKYVGAIKFAELTQQANNVYEKENAKITKHQDGTLKGFSKSYDSNPLNDFDDRFYALYKEEDLQKILASFIRNNKSDFTGH